VLAFLLQSFQITIKFGRGSDQTADRKAQLSMLRLGSFHTIKGRAVRTLVDGCDKIFPLKCIRYNCAVNQSRLRLFPYL